MQQHRKETLFLIYLGVRPYITIYMAAVYISLIASSAKPKMQKPRHLKVYKRAETP
jgi:hypothetical protein